MSAVLHVRLLHVGTLVSWKASGLCRCTAVRYYLNLE